MQKEIQLPFDGLYESISSYNIERDMFTSWCIENSKEYCEEGELSENEEDTKLYEQFTDANYEQYKKDYIETYAHGLARELTHNLGVPVVFSDIVLDSPKYYNFTTDRLFAKVDTSVLDTLYAQVDRVALAQYLEDHFKSRDGFASHYEHTLDSGEWSNPALYDHNQWHAVLETYVGQAGIELDTLTF